MTTPQFAPQQGFAPQPQFQPAQQAPAAPALNPSAWAVGAAQDAGGNGVAMAHLYKRTVVIVPLEHLRDQQVKNDSTKKQEVIRADIFILDGGTFKFGGSPNGKPMPTPDTQAVDQLPYLAENCRIYGAVIVNQLKDKVRTGVSVGRVETMQTGSGNQAWCLSTDATQEQLAMAQQLVMAHYQHRNFTNPVPRMLATQAAPQAQAMQYAQPQQPQWPAATPGVVAQPMAYAQPQQAPQPAQPQFQAPAVPQFTGFTPSAPPAMEDWTLNTMPPGVPAEQLHAWQTTTTQEARTQMLAAAGITGPGPVNPGRPTGL